MDHDEKKLTKELNTETKDTLNLVYTSDEDKELSTLKPNIPT